MELRSYQLKAIDEMRTLISMTGKRRIMLQAACGAGKTIIAAALAKSAIEKMKHVLFLVNRRDLVKQTKAKFDDFGLSGKTGVIMAGEEPDLDAPIQIASLQTYTRRLNLDSLTWNRWFHRADLVIYDEAHSCNARTYREVVDIYKERSFIVGLSATPCRSDGTGLGEVFDDIIQCVPMSELIRHGHLVPMRYFAPSAPDLERLRIVAGDYEQKELGVRVDKPQLVGDIFENWAKLAGGRPTVIFAVNVKHSKHIKEHFERRGVAIEHIDAHTKDDERDAIYRDFEAGKIQVLSNVGIAIEGSDFPWVSCIVLARPTKSLGRYIQMAGRGLRPFPGKSECILLDHAGSVVEHGFVDEDVAWSLEGKKPAFRKKKRTVKEKTIIVCEECATPFTGPKCSACGWEVPHYGKRIAAIEAELEEIERGKGKKQYSMAEKHMWYSMFLSEKERLNKSHSWLLAQYKSKFDVWPRGSDNLEPVPANDEVLRWLKYQRIKYAKSMKKKEEQQKLQWASNG